MMMRMNSNDATTTAVHNVDKIFRYFHIPWNGEHSIVRQCCIHCGDNRSALNIYLYGHSTNFYYQCNTHQCHEVFRPTILGFIRGMLSNQIGWRKYGDNIVPFRRTLQFVYDIADGKIITSKRSSYLPDFSVASNQNNGVTDSQIRQALQIPSQYFLERGIDEEILNSYNIGECLRIGKPMYKRTVVPIYDEQGHYVGCTGRSINGSQPKWLHHGFQSGNYLFNYGRDKELIRNTRTIILTEGILDCLKLKQTMPSVGVVSTFGVNLTDRQQFLLECSGCTTIIVLFDTDEAGRKACDKIKNKCAKLYNVVVPEYSYKDVGSMTKEQIIENFGGICGTTNTGTIW